MTDFINKLKSIVGPKGWTDDPAILAPHLEEPRGLFFGSTPVMVSPASVEEVANVVKACAALGCVIVPQGGNTGLSGGQIPNNAGRQGEILLSLSRLNHIRETDTDSNVIIVEAGCTLAALQQAAHETDRLFPLSLASEGSCQIGGTIATNAGGNAVLRYGSMRQLVLGIEAVLPDGQIWHGLRKLQKDNTGYDLKQLLIGSEGTLAVITAAACRIFPRPGETQTALVAVRSIEQAMNLFQNARQQFGEALTACELLPRFGLDLVQRHMPNISDPLATRHDWYVLVEVTATRADGHLDQALTKLLADYMDSDGAIDGVVAQSEAQRANIWALRENMSDAQRAEGGSIKHDISVPLGNIADFIRRATDAVTRELPGIRPVVFGHLGDGNIHFNLSQPTDADRDEFVARWFDFNRIVHDIAHDLGGSISAEHGLGELKRDEILRYKSPLEIKLMRDIKSAIDPQGIMNPGKLL